MEHRDGLLRDTLSLEQELAKFKQQSAFYQQDADVAKAAAEIVRKENKSLLDRLSVLEKENVLYHRVLTPDKGNWTSSLPVTICVIATVSLCCKCRGDNE